MWSNQERGSNRYKLLRGPIIRRGVSLRRKKTQKGGEDASREKNNAQGGTVGGTTKVPERSVRGRKEIQDHKQQKKKNRVIQRARLALLKETKPSSLNSKGRNDAVLADTVKRDSHE